MRADVRARALHLPDEGARAGSGARPARVRPRPAAGGLRRRHAARAAPPRAQFREPHPHEPRHAARRHPAESPALGGRAVEPHARRGRRGAHLSRRVRLARRARPAAAAARLRALRLRAAVPARERDDRQPRRGLRRAHRPRRARRRRRRRTARATPRRVLGHAAARRGGGHARLCARRGRRAAGGADGARAAHDLLRQEPQGERARLPLRAREPRLGRPGGRRRAARAVPRRLHGRGAPSHRGRPRLGPPAGRRRDGGARAGRGRRPARLRARHRLPGHRREPPPAVGPRGPARRGPRAARAGSRRARPLLHQPSRRAAGTGQRGRHPRPDESRDPHRPPAGGCPRAAARPGRTTTCSATAH